MSFRLTTNQTIAKKGNIYIFLHSVIFFFVLFWLFIKNSNFSTLRLSPSHFGKTEFKSSAIMFLILHCLKVGLELCPWEGTDGLERENIRDLGFSTEHNNFQDYANLLE